jgi:hypothetical protein
MDPLSAGIAGVLGIGSSLFSNMGAKQRQDAANRQNTQFWNMQNKYNTPKAQMARLKEAGLNPALIYGSGATNTGVAGSIAPAKASPYNIKDPTPTALNAAMLQSQIQLQNSQSGKNIAETKNIEENLPFNVESSRQIMKINSQKALQETTRTLELNESYQKRIDILAEQVKQSKSNTATKKLDATLSDAGTRVNDFIGWRKLSEVWNWATGGPAEKWLLKHIPSNSDLKNQLNDWLNKKNTNL